MQHPNYDPDENKLFPNDIAVMRVEVPMNLNHPNIDKVTMAPDDNYDYTTSDCWITGWGYTQGIHQCYVQTFSFMLVLEAQKEHSY